MKKIFFSVIIPIYNGSKYIYETVQSVLNQSYQHFELLLIDDASTDNTFDIISKLDDNRVKIIRHEENMGANLARRTGILKSSGEIIAFLDQDDYFHPEKLRIHADYCLENPEVGFTYNNRFELNYNSNTIREIWRPPKTLNLSDMVLGFPVAPSEMVLKKEWALKIDFSNIRFHGGEYLILCRLYLLGCQFANVDKALNYRRHHKQRYFSNLNSRCESEIDALKLVLLEASKNLDISDLQKNAFRNTYLVFANYAFFQNETQLGLELIRKAMQIDPSLFIGKSSQFVDSLIYDCIADDLEDHELLLTKVTAFLQPIFEFPKSKVEIMICRGDLIRLFRSIMWNHKMSDQQFSKTPSLYRDLLDEPLQKKFANDLINFENEFGLIKTEEIINKLKPFIVNYGDFIAFQRILGCVAVNRAFKNYSKGQFRIVPQHILEAISRDNRYIFNPGVLSILAKSIIRNMRSY